MVRDQTKVHPRQLTASGRFKVKGIVAICFLLFGYRHYRKGWWGSFFSFSSLSPELCIPRLIRQFVVQRDV